jgi:hypothetical protein
VVAFWDKLPKEAKVAVWVTISGALTALVDYLKVVELNDALVMAVINVLIVLANNRKQVITSRL